MAKDSNSLWDIDWRKAHEQYLDSLRSFSSEMDTSSYTNLSVTPWLQMLEFWGQSTTGFDSKNQQDILTRLFEQSKIFYSATEQFAGLLEVMSATPKGSGDWQVVLKDYFNKMKEQFVESPYERNSGQQDMAGLWQENLQQWLKKMSASSIFPGGFQQQEKFGFPDINSFFSTPGLGQSREYQEQLQENTKLWQEYLENYHEYEKVLSLIGRDSLDRLHEKIINVAMTDKKISSLRELYNLWIKAQEEVYSKVVFTKEYTELYGRLVNSLMVFRQHNQKMFDQILSVFNFLTGEELGSLNKTQQKLRRDIQLTQRQQEASQSEVEILKKELEKIRQDLSASKKK